MGPKPRPAAERFWSHVEKTPGCWNWIGSIKANGYGVFMRAKSEHLHAHRAAWEFTHGEIRGGLMVCAQMAEVRAALAAGRSQDAIATQYGVSQGIISRVKRGVLTRGHDSVPSV